MNLVKNGAVLLAALTTFAITSCGPKTKTLDEKEAREFLKDAEKQEDIAKKYKVKNEVFTWDCKVTGTGMKPGEKDGGTYGAIQFMIAYLANQNFMDEPAKIPSWLEHFKDLKSEYTSDVNVSKDPGHGSTLSYLDQAGFDDFMDDDDFSNPKFTVSQNLLHIKFDRTQKLVKGIEISFGQEVVVAKNGWIKYYTITLNNLEVDITYPEGSPLVKAKGTANGTVKCATNVVEK